MQQTSLTIIDGEPFFAHEASINFTPTQFSLDFKCITPRTDPRSKNNITFQIKHNVVMIEPWHMKLLLDLLNQMVKKYEKEFGNIKKPKSLEKAQKKQKVKKTPKDTSMPTYFG